jgi:hypothetical protein
VTPPEAGERLRELLEQGCLDLPLPGRGDTPGRFRQLRRLAATEDLSVGRLAEAHCDAVAIVAEAGSRLPQGALAGVWASKFDGGRLRATPVADGWRVAGDLAFCSGAGILDAAVVDSVVGDSRQAFILPLRDGDVDVDASWWRTPALAATGTGRVRFDLGVGADAVVGGRDFYLRRPGFWHGAVGVAACWLGAAEAIADTTCRLVDASNPHALANLGRVSAVTSGMAMLLDSAGAEIDRQPERVDAARALIVRHLVAAGCAAVIAASRRATGPGPLARDADHAQRVADLQLYIEQQHHETDLEEIGRARLGR